MSDSILSYDEIVDLRFDPFANNGVGAFTPKQIGYGSNPTEDRTVDANGQVKLFEAPQLNRPSTTVITIGATTLREQGRSKALTADEFSVIYYGTDLDAIGLGIIQFHPSRIGQQAKTKYFGLGHILQKISLDTRVPSTGNTTINGIKTFPDGLIRGSLGVNLVEKEISIGSWNMDTDSTKLVTHGITDLPSKIRNIYVIIYADAGTITSKPLMATSQNADPELLAGGVSTINATSIALNRRTGGQFDNTGYDDTGVNRGYIYVLYTP
jgi:hypothetical protein